MRVTNKMLSNNFLRDMRMNLGNMSRIQEQMTSGKEIRRPSDDPFKSERIMQLYTEIDTNKQYNENIGDVINWMDTTDTALNQAGNVLHRMRELLVSSGNAGYSSKELGAIKDEMNEKVGQFSQVLNTNFDGSYIFGGTRSTTKPMDAIPDGSNKKLIYYKKNEGELNETTALEKSIRVDNSKIGDNWGGKSIGFEVGNPPKAKEIKLDGKTVLTDIDKLVDNINSKITADTDLKDKVKAEKVIEKDGTFGIKLISNNKIDNIKITKPQNSDLPSEMKDLKDQYIYSNDLNMINQKLEVHISQGVTMGYNVNASEVLKYGTDSKDDLRALFTRIVNHLDGKNDSGVKDEAATKELVNKDLADITKAMDNILRIRAEVGAKQNRMDDAQDRNIDQNFNMTEILSKTEDIDLTEKTMEFAVMRTVYMAALQTSAKVIQPTLMDYLR